MKFTAGLITVCRILMANPQEPMWAAELVRQADLSRTALDGLIGRMRAQGWLEVVDDDSAGRRTYLRLTEDGQAHAAAVIDRADGRAASKRCGRCKLDKSRDSFARYTASLDGLSNRCKECVRWYQAELRRRPKAERPADYCKPCTKCKRTLTADAFAINRIAPDGLNSWCRQCFKEHHAATRPRMKEVARQRLYSISQQEYEELLAFSGNRCQICGCGVTPGQGRESITIDHDHACCPGAGSCGACLRGILCAGCNLVLGAVESRGMGVLAWAEQAQYYLDRYAAGQGWAKSSA